MKKNVKIFILRLVALLIVLFLLRGPIIRLFISHKTKQIEDHYSLLISYDKLRMSGVAGITVNNLSIMPKTGDTLFSANYIRLKMNPFKLLVLSPDLRKIDAENICISFIKNDTVSNFDFLFKGKKDKLPSADTLKKLPPETNYNYARSAENIFKLILGVLPATANFSNLNITYINGSYRLDLTTPSLSVKDNEYETEITSTENEFQEVLFAEGVINHAERKISARLFAKDKTNFSVPFMDFRWGANIQFDTLAFEFSGSGRKNDLMTIKGEALARGVSVFHQRVSPKEVVLEKGLFKYIINIGKNYFELDSNSVVSVNNFTCTPYLKVEKNKEWKITAALNKTDFPADDLFSSLPEGLFYNLEGIKTEGTLSYHFYLNLDFSRIDSLKLESILVPKNFHIIHFGNTDLRRMNDDFEYTAYDNGIPLRSFIVGPENINFRTLDRISKYLQTTVLQSEDGGFFYHKGFLPESIREALVQDIKEGKFKRGGSTISMQLVKNVFLSRNKTLARKFEEIMIVWLIENNHLSSKERMFEVYLNIIEWGPGVYGANEAARFYFDKDAKNLTVNEAIFLAGIIPSPRRALNSFTDDLQLKPQFESYYKLLAQRLRIKGLITEAEEAIVRPEVNLKGEAKRIIRIKVQNEER
jgi:hypothetical protein